MNLRDGQVVTASQCKDLVCVSERGSHDNRLVIEFLVIIVNGCHAFDTCKINKDRKMVSLVKSITGRRVRWNSCSSLYKWYSRPLRPPKIQNRCSFVLWNMIKTSASANTKEAKETFPAIHLQKV